MEKIMKPMDILKREHELISVMLEIIEKVCSKMETGEKIRTEHLADIVDFSNNFIDKRHHAKEEKFLFPALEQRGIACEGGSISEMLAEHAMGKNLMKGMAEALPKYQIGKTGAEENFIKKARGYVELLRGHVMKENNVLFIMADQHLTKEEQGKLMVGFEFVERKETGSGAREKYHELLRHLRTVYLQ
jgi:hemerythrin-like domain-containing protein